MIYTGFYIVNKLLYYRNTGRTRSIDLGFARFGLGGRVEDLGGNGDNPAYQQFSEVGTSQQGLHGIPIAIDIFFI